jgi:hypothetical protein
MFLGPTWSSTGYVIAKGSKYNHLSFKTKENWKELQLLEPIIELVYPH